MWLRGYDGPASGPAQLVFQVRAWGWAIHRVCPSMPQHSHQHPRAPRGPWTISPGLTSSCMDGLGTTMEFPPKLRRTPPAYSVHTPYKLCTPLDWQMGGEAAGISISSPVSMLLCLGLSKESAIMTVSHALHDGSPSRQIPTAIRRLACMKLDPCVCCLGAGGGWKSSEACHDPGRERQHRK
jgi:hypothetical protein